MSLAHPIPAAIDGLVALWSGHAALAYEVNGVSVPLLVVDGPPLHDYDDLRVLAVGVGAVVGAPAASDRTGYGPGGRRTASGEVACRLGVWSGDTDLEPVRATAFGVFDVLARLLTADRTLGGVVDWARITRTAYQPSQGPDGSGVGIDFTVSVEATRFDQGA